MWSISENNPEGRAFITVIIVFVVLAVLAFGLRVYSRRLHGAVLDASDYACLLGLVGVSVCGCRISGIYADFVLEGVGYRSGRHALGRYAIPTNSILFHISFPLSL
jgi:uncharacterized membrane protein YhaH (DUF805 family)